MGRRWGGAGGFWELLGYLAAEGFEHVGCSIGTILWGRGVASDVVVIDRYGRAHATLYSR